MDQKHPNLKIFRQHGFIPQGTSGSDQVIGRCPFCGHNKKFFVNPEIKKWDCKICGRKGGYQIFLKEIVKHCSTNFSGKRVELLCEKRGISESTFERWSVGYNPINETYVLPIWDENKKDLFNIRIYRKDGVLMNSAGCKQALYGWWQFMKPHRVIWLCEGEWDTLAMDEILHKMKLKDHIAVGAPGADQFRMEWSGHFGSKVVHTVYDNDWDKINPKTDLFQPSAGKTGMLKVDGILKHIAKSIDYIHWPPSYHDGYDINDMYRSRKGNAERCYRQIEAMLHPKPPKIIYPEGQEPEDVRVKRESEEAYEGPGLKHEEVYKGYRKWLDLPDPTCIDVAFGTVLSNRLPGEPVWMFLIGPSGCGKSELIMSLDDCPRIYPLSRLTSHTLVSGSASSGGGDPSLVPKLDGQCLALKDFTGVLGMLEAVQHDIFSQLRDAYDGKCRNVFGTGKDTFYKSKFGILAGVTEIIEEFLEGGTALGERFLGWKFPEVKGFAAKCSIMRKAIRNMTERDKELMREELREVAAKVLNHDFGPAPSLGEEFENKIMALSYWCAKMRGTVKRDKYSKEVQRRAYIEMPTRIAVQMVKLSFGLAQFRYKDSVDSEIYEIIKRIGIGTTPSHLESILYNMYTVDKTGNFGVHDIADKMNLPTEVCKRFAENLQHLKILKSTTPKGALTGTWQISKETLEMIELSEIYKVKEFSNVNVKEKIRHKRK